MGDAIGIGWNGEIDGGFLSYRLFLCLISLKYLQDECVESKFCEIGEGQAKVSFTGKLAIADISPEYGPTMGSFPMDYGICNVSN